MGNRTPMTSAVLINDLSGLGPRGARIENAWLVAAGLWTTARFQRACPLPGCESGGHRSSHTGGCQAKNHQILGVCDLRPPQVVGNRLEKLWKNSPRGRGSSVENVSVESSGASPFASPIIRM
jgi:hypothetical protein